MNLALKKLDLNKLIIFLAYLKNKMNQFCESSISHLNQSKLLVYENGTRLEDSLKSLQKEFKIQRKIKLTDSNAEITSVKSFYNGRKLFIEIIQEDEQDLEVDKSDQNDEENKNSSQ